MAVIAARMLGFPAMKNWGGTPDAGLGGECLENFEGWEGQAYIRQQRMSAAADVLGQ